MFRNRTGWWFVCLAAACVLATQGPACGGDDDDDDVDDTGDGSYNDELMEQCASFFAECLGISETSAELNYCDFIDDYKGMGACYDKALREFMSCVYGEVDCAHDDLSTVQPCVDAFHADIDACGGDDDDADDDDDDDDDDDSGDDDTWEDDDADDDSDDDADDDADDDIDDDADDDTTASAPVLGGGSWDPNPPDVDYMSDLSFTVCDVDDDLSGGTLYVWFAGTSQPAFGDGHIPWDEFVGGAPSAPNCASPINIVISVDLSANEGLNDDLCIDIEADDGGGRMSNKLEDVCVFVP